MEQAKPLFLFKSKKNPITVTLIYVWFGLG